MGLTVQSSLPSLSFRFLSRFFAVSSAEAAHLCSHPGSAGWGSNAVASSSPSWGTPPSTNSTRQTWQGGQQPPPSQAFPAPFSPVNGSPSPASKQRPGAPALSSANYPSQGAGFSRQPEPPAGRQAYPPEMGRPEAPSQQRPPYQPYPYRPQISQQPGGGQMQQQGVTQPNPPQMSRLQASRPGGLLTPQQQQQLRQFLPPQSAQPQLLPFSPLQQQQLQQQLWQQQQKGVLSPQGGFQPGQTNGQPLFSRPNLRAFGPAPGGAQASFQGLEPPKLSSSLSAAAAPWPGSQGGGSGGAYGQMVRPFL
jgi:hypothetical protein